MHAYLFNGRTLQATNGASTKDGYLAIYTVFISEELIYFDAVFFVKYNFQNPNILHTQCIFIEGIPKKLDQKINQDILTIFEKHKKAKGTKETDFPDSLFEKIRMNVINVTTHSIIIH